MTGGVAGYGQPQSQMAFGEPEPHIPSAPPAPTGRDLTPQDIADALQRLGDDEPHC